jgi:hypothetical protein
LFQTPASDDYYIGDTPPLEFPLADLLGGSADEIGGTQLSRAPPVTQPTQPMQEEQRVMMEDFHDSTQRAGEALDAAMSVEAEAQATGRVAALSGSATPQALTGGGPARRAR